MKQKIIKLNERQLEIVAEALEFYSRFMAGQVDAFPSSLENYMWNEKNISSFDEIIQDACMTLKKYIWGLERNMINKGIGWGKIPEIQIAYEMYKLMYKHFRDEYKKKHPDDTSWTVDDSEPLKSSKETFITVEDDNEKQGIKKC